MNELDTLTELAAKLQSIAQIGLTYTKDPYDKERFEQVREEAGLDVEPVRVIAIQDRNKHNFPKYVQDIWKVFVLCAVKGGSFQQNIETTESGYFSLDSLPVLDEDKTVYDQVKMCFEAYQSEKWEVIFD